jgi:hypothetical protein
MNVYVPATTAYSKSLHRLVALSLNHHKFTEHPVQIVSAALETRPTANPSAQNR